MLEIQNLSSGLSYLWWNCLGDCIGHKGGGTGFSTWAEWHIDSDTGILASIHPSGIILLMRICGIF